MAVERGWWNRSLRVLLRGFSTTTNVNNTTQAARVLLENWPTKTGPKHLAARIAEMAAMENALDAEQQAKARKRSKTPRAKPGLWWSEELLIQGTRTATPANLVERFSRLALSAC